MQWVEGARAPQIRRVVIATLPDEIVWEILVRLPTKVLLRCRVVCRSWCDIISAANFLLAHHKRQPSLPLAFFCGELSSCSRQVVDAAIDAFDLRQSPAKRQPVLRFNDYNLRRQFSIHASCDGLILLSVSNGSFYICNPTTRQWRTLPSLNGTCVVGMYPHGTPPEYRILHRKWGHQIGCDAYYVLTVGSSEEPRCLGPADSLSVKRSMASIGACVPVLLHSCLHWLWTLNDGLIVFDTVLESFRCIEAPTTDDDVPWQSSRVLEMDDMLGICHVNKIETMVEIWVLQDYKMEVWSLKYKIKLPMADMRCIAQKCRFDVFVVSENRDLLVQCNTEQHLFHCDPNGKLLQRWDRQLPAVAGYWFRESLFRHSFFQKQKGRRVKQPRFFSGL